MGSLLSNLSAESETITEGLTDWKQQVTARLSAHRDRRRGTPQPALPGIGSMEQPAPEARAARVAARVADRYAKAPTYSEMLAAQANNAVRAAEAATLAAQAAQEAAQVINDALRTSVESENLSEPTPDPQPIQYRVDPASLPSARRSQPSPNKSQVSDSVEPYPHVIDPFEEALVAPAQPLAARVLEFPRELVATRRVRPRIAEGPLRDAPADSASDSEKQQLRIFECEPDAISRQPLPPTGPVSDAMLPGWSSIRLDATPRNIEAEMSVATTTEKSARAAQGRSGGQAASLSSRAASNGRSAGHRSAVAGMLPLHVAPFKDRFMAAFIDMALVLFAFLLFLVVFVACTAHPPSGRPALIAASAALVGFIALYQWLFFTFAESTPGMRVAKIALCTFGEKNPDRKALQHRVGALFLAALPMGLGFLWALFDDDRLGWHDRMTQTYQRSYR